MPLSPMNCACERFTRQASERLASHGELPSYLLAMCAVRGTVTNGGAAHLLVARSLTRSREIVLRASYFSFPLISRSSKYLSGERAVGGGGRARWPGRAVVSHTQARETEGRKKGRGRRLLLLNLTWINNSVTFTTHYFPIQVRADATAVSPCRIPPPFPLLPPGITEAFCFNQLTLVQNQDNYVMMDEGERLQT